MTSNENENPILRSEPCAEEPSATNPDVVSVEYSYNFEQFVKMSKRVTFKVFLSALATVIAILAALFTVIIVFSDDYIVYIVAAVLFAVLAGVFAFSLHKGARTQREKSFTQSAKDGLVRERIEVTGNALCVTELGNDNRYVLDRPNIVRVQLYGDFFAMYLATGAAQLVPLNGETQKLYDALTDNALFERAAAANPRRESAPKERPTDVLSFEYELTREQSVRILRRYGQSKVVMGSVCVVIFLLAAVLMFVLAFVKKDEDFVKQLVAGSVLAVLGVFLEVLFALSVRKSASNGGAYFDLNSCEGKMLQRIELSQQGIVAVNVLKDYRTDFRIVDMGRVKRGRDFFIVEFSNGHILPIPFNAETTRLYELLVAAVPKPLGGRLK